MNFYRNKKTGAVVKTTCKVTGANWELVKPKDPKEPAKPAAAAAADDGKKSAAPTKTTTKGEKPAAAKKDAKA